MESRKENRKYRYYICGRCKTPIELILDDDPPSKCPDCGYSHYTRDYRDIPANLKIRIN